MEPTETKMIILGQILSAYQQKHDIENRQMAHDIGISASTLSRIKGGTLPDTKGLAKIISWMVCDV